MHMQGELGEAYTLYLLEDQQDAPVAVVLPSDATEQPLPQLQEVSLPCQSHVCMLLCRIAMLPSAL
jgi:hypothetical protein